MLAFRHPDKNIGRIGIIVVGILRIMSPVDAVYFVTEYNVDRELTQNVPLNRRF